MFVSEKMTVANNCSYVMVTKLTSPTKRDNEYEKLKYQDHYITAIVTVRFDWMVGLLYFGYLVGGCACACVMNRG